MCVVCVKQARNQERAVSWATWLQTEFRGHLFHPQPPTFCRFQASESSQRSLGAAGGQPSPRTVGANGGSTGVPGTKEMIFFQSCPETTWDAQTSAPKRVTTGSKQSKNACLSIPSGPGSLLEKRVFDPFLTHFWSQNGPFSRHYGIFHWPKRMNTGSKWAKNTCLSIRNGLGSLLEKCGFEPFVIHF